MRSRLDKLPVFDARETTVSAENYNLISLALKRLQSPIRAELPRLRSLDFFLERDLWIIVDRSQNDLPVVAWLNFQQNKRRNLVDAVHCQRRAYHTHAMIILDKAFNAIHTILTLRLNALNDGRHDVVALPRIENDPSPL